MEAMPHPDGVCEWSAPNSNPLPTFASVAPAAWREGLPELDGPLCQMRELTNEDAESLFEHLSTEEVARHVSPPPTSVEGFRAFIAWAREERRQGRYICYGVVPSGETRAVGLFQVAFREDAGTAEWGFILGASYWGSGLFLAGARRLLRFAFTRLGLRRLEARAMPANGRGVGALRKIGAINTGLLRGSLERDGEWFDQAVWVISQPAWSRREGQRPAPRRSDGRRTRLTLVGSSSPRPAGPTGPRGRAQRSRSCHVVVRFESLRS